jgi:hypothetical protein
MIELSEGKPMKRITVEIDRITEVKIDKLLRNTSASSISSLIAILVDQGLKTNKYKRSQP